jgi:hypothetical protein
MNNTKENNKIYCRRYKEKNKEAIRQKNKEYRLKNKEAIKERNKKYRLKNKEKIKKYFIKNKEKIKNKRKSYFLKNKEKINQKRKDYIKIKMKNDPIFKLLCNIRNRLNLALKNNVKSNKTKELFGCTVDLVKKHLESQFKEGMTWENHGVKGWHIDHIKPCSYFDLSDPEQQRKCFHYTNLQPLWWYENLKKRNKIL